MLFRSKTSINGFTNVEINNINDIINYSADHVFCGCLNYMEMDSIEQILSVIFEKIRPQGYCTLSFVDMKQVCRSYYENSLSNKDLLDLIKDHKAILSYQNLYELIEKTQSLKVVQTDFSNNLINIVIQRAEA